MSIYIYIYRNGDQKTPIKCTYSFHFAGRRVLEAAYNTTGRGGYN